MRRARRVWSDPALGRLGVVLALAPLLSAGGCDVLIRADDVKVDGLNFGPFVDGSDPSRGAEASQDEMRRLATIVAGHTEWIRTYSATGGLNQASEVARELGLKIAVGAWLGPDPAANQREIDNLIELANAGKVDLAVVGSETLLRGDLSSEELTAYVEQVKAAVPPDVPVTTADDCARLLRHPELLEALDVVFFNFYPYFEGHDVSCAVGALHGCYSRLRAAVGSKPILVSETGWPTCGDTILAAVASEAVAREYGINFKSWAQATGTQYFYFEAFDEPWKTDQEGPQGACWGLWNRDAELKDGMEAMFSSATVRDNWSDPGVPGGPGAPVIELTSVPAYGSFDDLQGRALHVPPTDYKVAAFIYVNGWWTKPYLNRPLSAITCDGRWWADVTTGGADQLATAIAAFLVPVGYDPPLLTGMGNIPAEIEENAVARVEVSRSPG